MYTVEEKINQLGHFPRRYSFFFILLAMITHSLSLSLSPSVYVSVCFCRFVDRKEKQKSICALILLIAKCIRRRPSIIDRKSLDVNLVRSLSLSFFFSQLLMIGAFSDDKFKMFSRKSRCHFDRRQ